jgi:hypothetical protein
MSERVVNHVDEASTFCRWSLLLWSVLFTFLPLLLERDLVALLTKHSKEEQAEKLIRGELRLLDVSYCEIGDDGAVIVAAFIKVDDTVEEVHLWSNDIGPRGAKFIANALKHKVRLRSVNLCENEIGDEGAEFFIYALNRNVCLIEFDVTYNNIAPESWATIEYLTQTRNRVLIPAAVRRASLYLIAARRATPIADAGMLSIFPKEIVKMIAIALWATRKDPKWIDAVSSDEHMESQKRFVEDWVRENE